MELGGHIGQVASEDAVALYREIVQGLEQVLEAVGLTGKDRCRLREVGNRLGGCWLSTFEAPATNPLGRPSLVGVLTRLDERLDALVGRLRGKAAADMTATALSALADLGLLWFVVGMARATDPRRRPMVLRALLLTGIAAPSLNYSLKYIVGRERPGNPGADGRGHLARAGALALREPSGPSFPSGHTLAAWCAASLLAEGDRLGTLYYLLAAGVAWSRVHLGHHHPSDVLGGAALGLLLAHALRRASRRLGNAQPLGLYVDLGSSWVWGRGRQL
jgi:membrane-associated phospholipid phosphatase